MSDQLRPCSAADLAALPDAPDGWGPWRLDPSLRVLYPIWPYRYEVDLDTCISSAETLDWIIQIARKPWGRWPGDPWTRDTIIGGFVRALNDVLDPQAFLCPFGRSRRVSRSKIAQLVQEAVEDGRVMT